MDIPDRVESLTPEWFTGVLRNRLESVTVSGVEILDAHSGTTGRTRVRLSYANEEAGDAAPPETLFVKLAPFDERQRAFLRFTGIGVAEAHFYETLGSELPVRLPRVWHAEYDGDDFVMVLEDLVASGCRFPQRDEADLRRRARSTVEELARLHAALWESPRFDAGGDLAWLPAQAGFGDLPRADAAAASGAYVRQAFEQFADAMPDAFRRVGDLYSSRTHEVLDLWDRGARTLVHGDCHIGNLFVDGDRTGFYDWAMVSHSPGVRDLAYTCCYSMEPAARRALERDLVARYVSVLGGHGIALDVEATWDQYRMFAVFAWVSATSTAAMGTKWQPRHLSYDAMVRATAAVEELDAVGVTERLLAA